MLSWAELVLYGLSKEYPRDIVSQIISFLRRESIYQSALESRDYHIDRMPRVERLFYSDSDHYLFLAFEVDIVGRKVGSHFHL